MVTSGEVLELLCSIESEVLALIQCDLAIDLDPGDRLAERMDPGSVGKWQRFSTRVVTQGEAYDWELDVVLRDDGRVCLHFAGRKAPEGLWVVAARSRRALLALLERGRQHEPPGPLKPPNPRRRGETDVYDYDELTRVNNEMTNLHRDIAKQASELEALNQKKNELLGMAAHDMRNPVAAIHAYSELLEADLASSLSEEQLDFLTTIKATSKSLLELVNDVLDLATIESGALSLDLEDADLVAVVERGVALNRALSGKTGVTIHMECEQDSATLAIDARKMHQVLDNLLVNALKFSPPGGVIHVKVTRQGKDFIVSVADQGPGIDPEERDRLFLPFQRGNSSETRGSGLGLAICRKIIDGHHGHIWVESERGKGSVFSFSLPTV